MKIIVVMKLSDKSLESHLRPISSIDEIEEIIVLRDSVGPQIPKVRYVTPPLWTQKNFILKSIVRIFQILDISKKSNPSLIASFLLPPHGVIAFLGGKIAGKPVSISIICNEEMDIFGIIAQKIFYIILKKTQIITVTGQKTQEKLLMHGIKEKNTYVLPHAVDIGKFKPVSTEKIYDLITVTRFDTVKNNSTLIHVVKEVIQQMPDIKVGIAGDGPLKHQIKQLIESEGLARNISLLGYVENVQDLYPKSKIFILTSKYEGVPFTVLEAMASGIPCIVSNVGDIPDISQNGLNAIEISDPMDIKAYSRAIIDLLNDPKHYKTLSQNGLNEIKNYHQPGNVTDVWIQIISEVNQ